MRHTGAGLAIPDFPLMFGHLIPDHWDSGIAVHFAHRVGALVGRGDGIRDVGARLAAPQRSTRPGAAGALLIVLVIVIQVTLGALTVLSRRRPLDQQPARRRAARWC